MPDESTTGLTDQAIRGSTVHSNAAQDFIFTTRDRLELCLTHHREKIEIRQQWPVPLGIFMSVILTLLTADFQQKKFGLDGSVWQAIFIIIAGLSGMWLIYSIFKAASSYISSWWKGEPSGLEAIIKELTTPIENQAREIREAKRP